MAQVSFLVFECCSHGPQIELYLAEEAIGLVKSLSWNVVKGPFWNDEDDSKAGTVSVEMQEEFNKEEGYSKYFEDSDIEQGYQNR